MMAAVGVILCVLVLAQTLTMCIVVDKLEDLRREVERMDRERNYRLGNPKLKEW